MLYNTLIYPFLQFSIVTWGNTYATTLQTLINLQKKAVRIIMYRQRQKTELTTKSLRMRLTYSLQVGYITQWV